MEPTRKTRAFPQWIVAAVLLTGCEDATGPSDLGALTPQAVGGAYALIVEQGFNQIGAPGEALPQPLGAKVVDRLGNPVSDASVRFEVTAGGGRIEGPEAVSDRSGIARSGTWTLGDAAVQQVRVSSGTARAVFLAHTLSSDDPRGRIAFVSSADGDEGIYLTDLSGGGPRRLTTSAGVDRSPSWSPDGTRIAFASEREGVKSIYTMLADGSGVERKTSSMPADRPAWSPDGTRIAFEALRAGEGWKIAAVDVSDASVVLLTTAPGFQVTPHWSPDGSRIAFVSDWMAYDFASDVFTINADGSDRRLLTRGAFFWEDLWYYLHPAWSPDGSLLAVVYGRLLDSNNTSLDTPLRFRVALLSAEGQFIKDVAWAGDLQWRELLDPGSIAWSPDGRYIAYTFVESCASNAEVRCRSVRYASLDGSLDALVADGMDPSWAP